MLPAREEGNTWEPERDAGRALWAQAIGKQLQGGQSKDPVTTAKAPWSGGFGSLAQEEEKKRHHSSYLDLWTCTFSPFSHCWAGWIHGKANIVQLGSQSRVQLALAKRNAQDAVEQQLERSGAGTPKEREYA